MSYALLLIIFVCFSEGQINQSFQEKSKRQNYPHRAKQCRQNQFPEHSERESLGTDACWS